MSDISDTLEQQRNAFIYKWTKRNIIDAGLWVTILTREVHYYTANLNNTNNPISRQIADEFDSFLASNGAILNTENAVYKAIWSATTEKELKKAVLEKIDTLNDSIEEISAFYDDNDVLETSPNNNRARDNTLVLARVRNTMVNELSAFAFSNISTSPSPNPIELPPAPVVPSPDNNATPETANGTPPATPAEPEIKTVEIPAEQWGMKFSTSGRAFYMQLLPAIKSNLPVQGGVEVPGVQPGLLFRVSNNVVKHRIPGFYPIYQPMGIESVMCTVMGMFTGSDGLNVEVTEDNEEAKTSSNVTQTFRQDLISNLNNADSQGSRFTNVPTMEGDAFNAAQTFYNEVVLPNVEVTLEINSNKYSHNSEKKSEQLAGGSDGLFRDGTTGNARFKGLVRKFDFFYTRTDRVAFIIDLEIVNMAPVSSEGCVDLVNKINEAADTACQTGFELQADGSCKNGNNETPEEVKQQEANEAPLDCPEGQTKNGDGKCVSVSTDKSAIETYGGLTTGSIAAGAALAALQKLQASRSGGLGGSTNNIGNNTPVKGEGGTRTPEINLNRNNRGPGNTPKGTNIKPPDNTQVNTPNANQVKFPNGNNSSTTPPTTTTTTTTPTSTSTTPPPPPPKKKCLIKYDPRRFSFGSLQNYIRKVFLFDKNMLTYKKLDDFLNNNFDNCDKKITADNKIEIFDEDGNLIAEAPLPISLTNPAFDLGPNPLANRPNPIKNPIRTPTVQIPTLGNSKINPDSPGFNTLGSEVIAFLDQVKQRNAVNAAIAKGATVTIIAGATAIIIVNAGVPVAIGAAALAIIKAGATLIQYAIGNTVTTQSIGVF